MEKNVAIGRRKAAIARVFLKKGKGEIIVNKKDFKEYFPLVYLQNKILEPLKLADMDGKFSLKVNVRGGGVKGQAEAVQLGIARAVLMVDEEIRPELKKHRLLTRDPRAVERKKPGYRKARKKEQYSKR
ncbi:MAG: 30S ribosomal protein S9 [Chitinophagales bacterium]|nr:30S ribosomal protein S9 [Chitinophagales bacterium]